MALGDARGIEGARQANERGVVRLVHRRRIAGLDPEHLRPFDEALGAQEADRELVLVAGSPHRHRHCNRFLVRPGCSDLERLLADHAIGSHLERVATDRDDPRRRDVAGWRWKGLVDALGHGPSLVPGVPVADRTDGESLRLDRSGILPPRGRARRDGRGIVSDWVCGRCKSINRERAATCYSCGGIRGAIQLEPSGAVATPASAMGTRAVPAAPEAATSSPDAALMTATAAAPFASATLASGIPIAEVTAPSRPSRRRWATSPAA